MSEGKFGQCCCTGDLTQWIKTATVICPWRRYIPFWQQYNPGGSPDSCPAAADLPDAPSCDTGFSSVVIRTEISNIEIHYICPEDDPTFDHGPKYSGTQFAQFEGFIHQYDPALDTQVYTHGYSGVNVYDECEDPNWATGRITGEEALSMLCNGMCPTGPMDSVSVSPSSFSATAYELNPDGITYRVTTLTIEFSGTRDRAAAQADADAQLAAVPIVGENLLSMVTDCSGGGTVEDKWFAGNSETSGIGDGHERIKRVVIFYHPTRGWSLYAEDAASPSERYPDNSCVNPYLTDLYRSLCDVFTQVNPGDPHSWLIGTPLAYDSEYAAARLTPSAADAGLHCQVVNVTSWVLARRSYGNFPSGISCAREHVFEVANDDTGATLPSDPGPITIGYCSLYWRETNCIDTDLASGLWLFDPSETTDLGGKVIGDMPQGRIWISYPEDRPTPTTASCCEPDEPCE